MAPSPVGVHSLEIGTLRGRLLSLAVVLFLLVIVTTPARADAGGDVESTYSESNGCGVPRLFSALATRSGGLSDSEPIRGPFGAMFGRTVGQARAALVAWTVPFANGLTVLVHQRAWPAFQQAANNLVASGGYYLTRSGETFGFTARTVSGTRSISYHALGAAVDVNSQTNPSASSLISDMPPWYVDAWRAAGFCWGGSWVGNKDPMHMSWMGPVATPGYGSVPTPYPSLAAQALFHETSVTLSSGLGGRRVGATDALADLTGDGSVDAIRVRTHPQAGPTLEIMGSWADLGICGFSRFQLPGADLSRPLIFGNVNFGSRPDLVFLDLSGSQLGLQIFDAVGFYQQARSVTTGASADASATYLMADYDSDGKADLFKIAGTNLEIWDGASGFANLDLSAQVPIGAPSRVLIGDRDLDGRPDLYAVGPGQSMSVFTAASGYGSTSETATVPIPVGPSDVVRISDYDGDGNGDLYRLDPAGQLTVTLGNAQIYADIDGWFRAHDFKCDPGRPPYDYSGRFADDEGNQFVPAIEWAAAAGVTAGCNPPFNDWFCPKLPVTRGQMATLLTRALHLPDTTNDFFLDDAGSSHEADINRLAAAGITAGCETGAYCPEGSVTREQMATFLVRAYQLPASTSNPFADVGGIHAADVAALFASGTTSGCSVSPVLFCPTASVLREQMAAFLYRLAN
jgi:hypothetical protein